MRVTVKEVYAGTKEARDSFIREDDPDYRVEWAGNLILRFRLPVDEGKKPKKSQTGEELGGMTAIEFVERTDEGEVSTPMLLVRLQTPLLVSGHMRVFLLYIRSGPVVDQAFSIIDTWDLRRPLSEPVYQEITRQQANLLLTYLHGEVYHARVISKATPTGREYHLSLRQTHEAPQFRLDTKKSGGPCVWPTSTDCALLHHQQVYIISPNGTSEVDPMTELELMRRADVSRLHEIYLVEDARTEV